MNSSQMDMIITLFCELLTNAIYYSLCLIAVRRMKYLWRRKNSQKMCVTRINMNRENVVHLFRLFLFVVVVVCDAGAKDTTHLASEVSPRIGCARCAERDYKSKWSISVFCTFLFETDLYIFRLSIPKLNGLADCFDARNAKCWQCPV